MKPIRRAFAALDALRTEPSRRTANRISASPRSARSHPRLRPAPVSPKGRSGGNPRTPGSHRSAWADPPPSQRCKSRVDPRDRRRAVSYLARLRRKTMRRSLAEALLSDLFKDAATANKAQTAQNAAAISMRPRCFCGKSAAWSSRTTTFRSFPGERRFSNGFPRRRHRSRDGGSRRHRRKPKDAGLYYRTRGAMAPSARRLFFNIATRIEMGSSPNGARLWATPSPISRVWPTGRTQ